jgi:hypothetical protein
MSPHLDIGLFAIAVRELVVKAGNLASHLGEVFCCTPEQETFADLVHAAGDVARNLVDSVVDVLSPPALDLFLCRCQ